MNTGMPTHQRGLSFGGFLLGAFLLVLLGTTALKLVPAYMENEKIKNLFTTMAHDPDIQKATPYEIQMAFNKRSSIDDITAIKSGDIEVSNDNGALYLTASYAVKVPLVANISLYLEFNPSSAE